MWLQCWFYFAAFYFTETHLYLKKNVFDINCYQLSGTGTETNKWVAFRSSVIFWNVCVYNRNWFQIYRLIWISPRCLETIGKMNRIKFVSSNVHETNQKCCIKETNISPIGNDVNKWTLDNEITWNLAENVI